MMHIALVLLLAFSPALAAQGQQFVDGPELKDLPDFLNWGMKVKSDGESAQKLCETFQKDLGLWWSKNHQNRRLLITARPLFGEFSLKAFLSSTPATNSPAPGITLGMMYFVQVAHFIVSGNTGKEYILTRIKSAIERKIIHSAGMQTQGLPWITVGVYPQIGHQNEFFARLDLALREDFTRWLRSLNHKAVDADWRVYITSSEKQLLVEASKTPDIHPHVSFVFGLNTKGRDIDAAVRREINRLKERVLKELNRSRNNLARKPRPPGPARFSFA